MRRKSSRRARARIGLVAGVGDGDLDERRDVGRASRDARPRSPKASPECRARAFSVAEPVDERACRALRRCRCRRPARARRARARPAWRVAAGRLKRITWSIMMPFARPWCRSATVDSACAHEWTAPRSFWNAIAPIIELISMSPRALMSRPLRTAIGSARRGDAHALERRCRRTADDTRATGTTRRCASARPCRLRR